MSYNNDAYAHQAAMWHAKFERERLQRVAEMRKELHKIETIDNAHERLQAKRRLYACGPQRFVTMTELPSWAEVSSGANNSEGILEALAHGTHSAPPTKPPAVRADLPATYVYKQKPFGSAVDAIRPVDLLVRFPVNEMINRKISLFQGDITTLEVDAIVNAANSSLRGGGGIDGAIHSAAGELLYEACVPLGGCPTGYTKATLGFCLPALHVLHTVGPIERGDRALENCYRSILDHVLASHNHKGPFSYATISKNSPMFTSPHAQMVDVRPPEPYSPDCSITFVRSIRTLAICCVSTGVFNFPRVRATHIALCTTRRWLEEHGGLVDRIIFVVFGEPDRAVYAALLPAYFPTMEPIVGQTCSEGNRDFFPFDADVDLRAPHPPHGDPHRFSSAMR